MPTAAAIELIRSDNQCPHITRELAEDHLTDAETLIHDLFPDVTSVVLDESVDHMARIVHILGRHGALLYSAAECDPLIDLIETHLDDALTLINRT